MDTDDLVLTTAGMAVVELAGQISRDQGRDEPDLDTAARVILQPVAELFFGPRARVCDPGDWRRFSPATRTGDMGLFYDFVRRRLAGCGDDRAARQDLFTVVVDRVAAVLHEDPAVVTFTPSCLADWMIRATDTLSRRHFGHGLASRGIAVGDAFSGAGVFPGRLIDFLHTGDNEAVDLARLVANDIVPLARDLTAAVIADATGQLPPRRPACNTFTSGAHEFWGAACDLPVKILLGAPPLGAPQGGFSQPAAHHPAPEVDKRITDTYAAAAGGSDPASLYDDSVRALRWATDAVGQTGIVAFLTSNSWLSSLAGRGIRTVVEQEFSEITIVNLRGDRGKAGRAATAEGDNIVGAEMGIHIFLGVKNPAATTCVIRYAETPEALSAKSKLAYLADHDLDSLDTATITPDSRANWLPRDAADFSGFFPLAAAGDDTALGLPAVFLSSSQGLDTARDRWCWNFSRRALIHNVQSTIRIFNQAVELFDPGELTPGQRLTRAEEFLRRHPELTVRDSISWDRSLLSRLAEGQPLQFDPANIRRGLYRPTCRQWVYFDRGLNDMRGRLPEFFPTAANDNLGFFTTGPFDDRSFGVCAADGIVHRRLWESRPGYFFPRWRWQKVSLEEELAAETDPAAGPDSPAAAGQVVAGYRRVDNISDAVAEYYRRTVDPAVGKDDIFFYVYGWLHNPHYRERYRRELNESLPRIPAPSGPARFRAIADLGQKLMGLHLRYDLLKPWNLSVSMHPGGNDSKSGYGVIENLSHPVTTEPSTGGRIPDPTTIRITDALSVAGIPECAGDFLVGSRSPLRWLVHGWAVTRDETGRIINDPNRAEEIDGNPRAMVTMIGQLTTMSVVSAQLIDEVFGPVAPTGR
ncbi:type ISP restriction/modification enzyme [Corynebacterium mendelii]|uniref:Type ISP restriction-modification enzyme LLaBIII C-terminal specificity domain-containing protein n=1 Tax=Corynebacterium mendelii TaxID=2765362 RepID=A0A939ISS5_9CORY|nr:type ISP restriction/modification enzyme [Corynebacterium mendelii]MBN9643084.1 hypothetical protein [Corynebacterium mendelii]